MENVFKCVYFFRQLLGFDVANHLHVKYLQMFLVQISSPVGKKNPQKTEPEISSK